MSAATQHKEHQRSNPMTETKQPDVTKPDVTPIDWTKPVETLAGVRASADFTGAFPVRVVFPDSSDACWFDRDGRLEHIECLGPIIHNVVAPSEPQWTDPAASLSPGRHVVGVHETAPKVGELVERFTTAVRDVAASAAAAELSGKKRASDVLKENLGKHLDCIEESLPRLMKSGDLPFVDVSSEIASMREKFAAALSESPAPKDWSKGRTPKGREVTFLNDETGNLGSGYPWAIYKGKVAGVVEPFGELRQEYKDPTGYSGVGPNRQPIPDAAWSNIDAWIDSIESPAEAKPVEAGKALDAETWPKGAVWVRFTRIRDTQHLVFGVADGAVQFLPDVWHDFSELAADYEWSEDRTTWHPCTTAGVAEAKR